jgi:hypothetical protein
MEEPNQSNWGMHINRTGYSGERYYPKWLSKPQREQWDRQGLVVWSEDFHQIVNIKGGNALRLLELLKTDETWRGTGIIIGEPATRLFIDHPDQKLQNVLVNQMHLNPKQVELLLDSLRSNIGLLKEIGFLEEEDRLNRLNEVYSLLMNLRAEKKKQKVHDEDETK